MRAGDPAVKISDARDHRRPGLSRRIVVGAIVAARVEAQAAGFVQRRNAAIAQIRFCEGPCERLRHGEQPPCRLRRSGLRWHKHRLRRWLQDRSEVSSESGAPRPRRHGNRASPQLSRITSSRSPCSPVAASVHLPAAPRRDSGPLSRTNMERPGVLRTSPTSQNGPHAVHWRGNGGTPPRPRARDGAPARKRRAASCRPTNQMLLRQCLTP